ncbi:hypothetical protein GMORB2_2518 [Geosmithia morbida]|uniref:Uncharacterized protein n=1 Tax=Geosmithia morbida TaxID=1094350 RepID=A0A9P4YR39_9HYPO|nr:uncharacterized protein GMORB2_2518 [Geosmithia morbida]KAF4121032.1 hypothetical protein GMORB2_2518 [Geosmithia morbida]
MAAINSSLISREVASHLVKRKNWAAKEAGVIVVFCIVFIVGVFLIGLWISKCIQKRKANKPQQI